MVLCKFFQQGTCRFGSKCANEHLDIKQMVKTDVEIAVNGKQWPLSTYGPFKDRPSIPNFIEDQSFEEVRMLCYEAKQKNFFDQFHQQFNKEALDANNKMKALLQMTPDILEVLINVYDVTVHLGKTTSNVNNPFGYGNSTGANAGSIFAKPAPNNSANNLFSSNNNTFNSSNQGAGGVFTNASTFSNQQQQPQTSIFGQPANSIFRGNTNNVKQNTSIFTQQQTQSNIFASSTQQQQQNSTGLFSQQNQFLQQPNQSTNIFTQPSQVSQPQQGLFAQAAQTMHQQQNNQQQGLFAQAAQQTSASQGLFAQAAQQTQNIFNQALQQQQQTNPNMFQQNIPNAGSQQQQTNSNIFQQAQPIVNQQPSTGVFQQAALQTQTSIGQMNPATQVNSTLYSRLEDLTPGEIEAFKADYFLPGKIPFNPPPRELIN